MAVEQKKAGFSRNVGLLIGGAAAGQAVAVVAAPIVTRLYSPAQFGLLGIYTSFLGILAVVAMLRYELAIPGARTENDATNLVGLAGLVALGFAVLLCGAISLARMAFAGSQSLRALGNLVWLLPLGVIATSAYQTLTMWAIRRGHYRNLAKTKLSQNIGMIVTQIGLAIVGIGSAGLLVGHVVGQAGGIGTLARGASADRGLASKLSIREMVRVARSYIRFPVLSGPAALLDAMVGFLPTIVLASLYGAAVAGLFTLVQRVVAMPLSIVAGSLGQAFFGELGALSRARPGDIKSLFVRRLRQVSLIGLILVAGILVLSPLVPLAFGERWAQATLYIRILSPALFFGFVANPFGFAFDVLQRQDLHLIRELLRAAIMLAAFLIAYVTRCSWTYAVVLISAAGTLNGLVYLGVTWLVFEGNHKRLAVDGYATLESTYEKLDIVP